MAKRPERVLALDIGSGMVRGIILSGSDKATAGGYAQLALTSDAGAATTARRIAAALDVKSTLPVVIACDEGLAEQTSAEIVAQVRSNGFTDVTVVSRHQARQRANPDGGEPASLVDAEIAPGLLTSHAGLTLGDLAPVVGAGLGMLGLGRSVADGVAAPVAVWAPDIEADTEAAASAVDPEAALAGIEAETQQSVHGIEAESEAQTEADFEDDTEVNTAGASVIAAATAAMAANLHGDPDATVPPEAVADLAADVDATVPPEAVADLAADVDATVPPEAAADLHGDSDATVPPEAAATVAASRPTAAPVDPFAAEAIVAAPEPEPAAANEPVAEPFFEEAKSDDVFKDKRGAKSPVILLLLAIAAVVIAGLFISQCGGSNNESADAEANAGAADTSANDDDAGEDATTADAAASETDTDTDTDTESATDADAAPAEDAQAVEPTAAPEPTVVPEPTATAEPTAEPEPTADPLEGLPPLSSLPERGAIFRPPVLYLEGPVQTQEQADALYQAAIAVVGPDNVVNEYVVRPDAPAAVDGNVRVEQAVLFQSGSAVISEEFIPTLELGVAVMGLNPQVQMVVEGHTDSIGSEASNTALSLLRAEAVVAYLVSRGVDAERLEAVGLGESTPVASNETDDGRQINRRIEVNLLDLLAAE